MLRSNLPLVLGQLGVLACLALAWNPLVFAQENKTGLSPENQKKYEELIRSAKTYEMLSYIAIGVGFLLILAAIPLGIYTDRRKKARRRAAQPEAKETHKASTPGEQAGASK